MAEDQRLAKAYNPRMLDEYPHVFSLTYRIVSDDGKSYATTAETEGHLGLFRFKFTGDTATFFPETVFASQSEAQDALEPHLDAWESHAALTGNAGWMRFKFLHSTVNEVLPQEGNTIARITCVSAIGVSGDVGATRSGYPGPPPGPGFVSDELRKV
jgi:hypothetical protein